MASFFHYFRECLKLIRPQCREEKFKLKSLKRLVPFIKPQLRSFITGAILMFVLSSLALPGPYLMKIIFDNVLRSRNISLLNTIIVALLAVQFVRMFISVITAYHFDKYYQEISVRIKKELFNHIMRLPLSFYEKHQTGYILSRIGEVEGLSIFFSSVIVSMSISILEFFLCLGMLFYLNINLTIISLLMLPLFYLSASYMSRAARKLSKESYERTAIAYRSIQDSLSGVEVVKLFCAEERETRKVSHVLSECKNANIMRNMVAGISSETLGLIGALGGYVILWLSGYSIIKGTFTVGSYIAYAAYVGKLYGPSQQFANMKTAFQAARAAFDRVMEIMDMESEEAKRYGQRMVEMKRHIEYRNVCFSYDSKPVLSHFNIIIKRGEKIVLAGSNGAGKSTVIKLLLGLYKAQEGRIFIDDQDITCMSLSCLRQQISIISQNTFLFNDTIRNNILIGKPDADEKDIIEALKLSGAYNFVNDKERALDTEIGERGVRLSGGERQKISIARAILKNSEIIIFDEATTHLDSESEQNINSLLLGKFADRTCISISHKIRNVPGIDKVYLLRGGQIIDM